MNLPTAPPAFDATTGPRTASSCRPGCRRRGGVRAGAPGVRRPGGDLRAVVAVPVSPSIRPRPPRPTRCGATWPPPRESGRSPSWPPVLAARAGAVVTVTCQAVMAVLVCLVVFGGAAVQSHQDQRCRDLPSASGCPGQDLSSGSGRP
ncbi:DUF6234 family protein [Streptomyces tricolor]|nr:DUF6234 family protein [Streptomyces tricolor]